MHANPMTAGEDRGEGKNFQPPPEESEFGLERIMAYAISAIGLSLILLKIMNSP